MSYRLYYRRISYVVFFGPADGGTAGQMITCRVAGLFFFLNASKGQALTKADQAPSFIGSG
jgi:hypothetical protein